MFTTTVTASATISPTEQVTSEKLNLLGAPTVTIAGTADAVDISNGAVDTLQLADGAVTNAKVDAAAAISLSKLEAVASGKFVVGNAANVPLAHELLGDAPVSRTVSLVVSGIAPGALAVGNELQVGTVTLRGYIVKLGAESGSPLQQTAHIDINSGSTSGLAGVAQDCFLQPTTMVLRHASATRPFSLGSTIAGATASARVLTCSAGVSDAGTYLYTVTMDSVSGHFVSAESVTVDGAGASLSVNTGSGRTTVGATLIATGATVFSTDTSVLAASIDDVVPPIFTKAANIRTETADTSGKVLTSTGAFTAPTWQSPVVSSPLMRGGASPVIPPNWIGGSTTDYAGTVNASAWELKGWTLDTGVYYAYLWNGNFTGAISANDGEILSGDLFTIFRHSTHTANPFETLQSVGDEALGIASAYAVYRVDGAPTYLATVGTTPLTNVRKVKFVRHADSTPITWNSTTYDNTAGGTTDSAKAIAGRLAFSCNGGYIFKCGSVTRDGTPIASPSCAVGGTYANGAHFVGIFSTPAAATSYSVNILASGNYQTDITLGVNGAYTQYTGGAVVVRNKTTRYFNFSYDNAYVIAGTAAYRWEPREMSVLIYEQ